MAPDLFHKCQKNCVNPLKSLRLSDFPIDGLITPTLKAAGSNPVGRTKIGKSESVAYRQWVRFFVSLHETA